jgi:hypothetical protein
MEGIFSLDMREKSKPKMRSVCPAAAFKKHYSCSAATLRLHAGIDRMFHVVALASLLWTASALYHPATRKGAIDPDRCTAIAASRAATVDGSTFNTHNSDCAECDWRVNKVPARDWPEGHLRPIYLLTGTYPRQVRKDRGYTWSPENLEHLPQRKAWEHMLDKTIIGHIPQVAHTYGLIEGYDFDRLF